ncbi:CPBP family intramembrane glutamic endopeptidase [Lacunimicrobium album]
MPQPSAPDENDDHILIFGLILEFALILITFAVGYAFSVDVRRWLIPQVSNAIFGVIATIPLYALFLILWYRSPRWMLDEREFLIETLGRQLSEIGVFGCFLLATMAGIGEEYFFRGALQTLFSWPMGLWGGILIANIIFALMHYVSFSYAAFAFAAGLYFSLLDQSGLIDPALSGTGEPTRNLLAPIISHGLYDFLAFVHVSAAWKARQASL